MQQDGASTPSRVRTSSGLPGSNPPFRRALSRRPSVDSVPPAPPVTGSLAEQWSQNSRRALCCRLHVDTIGPCGSGDLCRDGQDPLDFRSSLRPDPCVPPSAAPGRPPKSRSLGPPKGCQTSEISSGALQTRARHSCPSSSGGGARAAKPLSVLRPVPSCLRLWPRVAGDIEVWLEWGRGVHRERGRSHECVQGTLDAAHGGLGFPGHVRLPVGEN